MNHGSLELQQEPEVNQVKQTGRVHFLMVTAPFLGLQGGLLKDALELVKAQNGSGRTRYTIKPMEEKLSFDKGFYVFIRAVQMLVSNNKGVVVVNSSQSLLADSPTACSTAV